MWVKLFFQNKTLVLGIIYRPRNTDINMFFNSLKDILYNIYSEYDNVVCLGDFNINMLDMNTASSS